MQNEERYRIIAEIASEYAYSFSVEPDGKLVCDWVTDAAVRLTGYSKDEMRSAHSWGSIVYQDDLPRIQEQLKELLAGHPQVTEYRIVTKGGDLRYVRDHSRPIWDEKQKRVVRIYGAILDITDRRTALDASKKNEAKLNAILNAIPDLMFEISKEGVFLSHKGRREDLYVEPEEFLGKNFDQVLPKDIARQTRYHMARVMKSGRPQVYEYQLLIGDQLRHFEARMVAIDKDAVLVIIRDITERTQAAEALRESEGKYSNLFHNSNDAIFVHDLDGNILEVNKKVLEMFGYTLSEIKLLKIADLHPPEALEKSRWAFNTVSAAGYVNFEIDFRKKSGEIFPAEVSASLFEINERRVIQGIVRDIIQRKRSEEELKAANLRLKLEREALKEKNIALKEVLSQIEDEKKKIAKRFQANVDRVVVPMLKKLIIKTGPMGKADITLLENTLNEITSPFINKLESCYARLTPREVEICNMIKNGMTSKEIASSLNISVETIRSQRKNIRRKLEISDQKINLSSFLQTI
jgi:PAS domain S-box-containing protein